MWVEINVLDNIVMISNKALCLVFVHSQIFCRVAQTILSMLYRYLNARLDFMTKFEFILVYKFVQYLLFEFLQQDSFTTLVQRVLCV